MVAKNSEVFAESSPVTIDSSGFLAVATSSGEKIFGFCLRSFTAIATNQTGSGVQTTDPATARFGPPIIGPKGVYFWADSDLAYTDTDAGAYADVASVASGVVTLNLAAGTTGQFFVIGLLSAVDPLAEGDTDKIVVTVAEPQDSGFAQT